MYQAVYHGSPHNFNKFDFSHIGTGEGAQAYGWGGYVTEVEGIGRTYVGNEPSTFHILYKGNEIDINSRYEIGDITHIARILFHSDGNLKKAIGRTKKQ